MTSIKSVFRHCFDPEVLAGVGGMRLTRGAWLALAVVLFAGTIFVAATVQRAGIHPLPWVDEMSYADPFLNAAEGKGLTSGVWDGQPYGQTWACNSPLYGWMAFPALRMFGATVEVWRGFWASAYAVFVVVLLAAMWGLGVLRSPWAVLPAGLIMLTASSLVFLPTSGRGVDMACLGVVSCTAAWLAFVPGGGGKAAGLLAGGFLAPWAGLQLIPALGCVVLCFLLLWWRPALVAGSWLAAGIVAGLAVMLAVFASLGVAHVYLAKTIGSGFTTAGALAQAVVMDNAAHLRSGRYDIFTGIMTMVGSDPVLAVACIGALACCVLAWLLPAARGLAGPGWVLALLGVFAMPAAMISAGRFEYYYYWLASVPMILSVAYFLRPRMPFLLRSASAATLILALAMGAQASWLSSSSGQIENNRELMRVIGDLVERHINPTDVPFVDSLLYWEARRCAPKVYGSSYSGGRTFPRISPEEQATFTVVIMTDEQFGKARERGKLGEIWTQVESVTLGKRQIGVWKRNGGAARDRR